MRVLLVTHLFPPRHSAGTELYTAELGARLAARGHEVVVFTTDKDVGREDLSTREYEHRGLRVVELTNNLYLDEFRQTWDRPAVAQRFGALLDELRPDVVHFQHLMYLGVGCAEEARRRKLPALMTLHDFWLECPRLGQLVHADGGVCHVVDHARCGTCLPSFEWRQSPLARRTGRALARVHAATGLDLAPLARGAARWTRGRAAGGSAGWRPPAPEIAARHAALARERADELRRRVTASVERFLAPSEFLRARAVDFGLPVERVHHLPTGVDTGAFSARPRTRAERLRVGFLGTLVPLKGAHVLVAAWERLAPDERARGELVLYGPETHAPEYVRDLRARAARIGARVGGPLERDAVPDALAAIDLLVVPSTWFENRPLVLLEALCAGVPLLVSDLGGMAELVREGRDGWRFPAGDDAALASRLRALLADRAPLDALRPAAEDVPTWDAFTTRVLEHYAAVGGGARA